MIKVWTLPVSLAATKGISIDFYSSGYLDVSVRQVTFPTLCIQIRMYRYKPIRVAPFGNLRVKACRSEERRVGKGVDLGGRRIIKKKKRRYVMWS